MNQLAFRPKLNNFLQIFYQEFTVVASVLSFDRLLCTLYYLTDAFQNQSQPTELRASLFYSIKSLVQKYYRSTAFYLLSMIFCLYNSQILLLYAWLVSRVFSFFRYFELLLFFIFFCFVDDRFLFLQTISHTQSFYFMTAINTNQQIQNKQNNYNSEFSCCGQPMEISQSRLSSITQQSNQAQASLNTQSALLNIYYQLYAINYTDLELQPKQMFKSLSTHIQQQIPNKLQNFKPFSESQSAKKSEMQYCYIKQSQKQPESVVSSRMIAGQQLEERIRYKISQSPTNLKREYSQAHQQLKMKTKNQAELDQTAESRISIGDILIKLGELDQERTKIKFQVYSEETSKLDSLYLKWTNLHQKMKEVLEIYLNKVGNGKSLLQLYNDWDKFKNSKKVIDGYSEKQLLLKLDIYIQSLFLDEREILLYRSASQRSRSLRTNAGSRAVRKKLIFNS